MQVLTVQCMEAIEKAERLKSRRYRNRRFRVIISKNCNSLKDGQRVFRLFRMSYVKMAQVRD